MAIERTCKFAYAIIVKLSKLADVILNTYFGLQKYLKSAMSSINGIFKSTFISIYRISHGLGWDKIFIQRVVCFLPSR